MYGEKHMQDVMSIYKDPATGMITCAPFGPMLENLTVKLPYPGLNQTMITLYGWLHMSCQYNYKTSVVGTANRM